MKKYLKGKRDSRTLIDCYVWDYDGIEKTEPLEHEFQGLWSIRIDDANRLVYRIENGQIEIIQCRAHRTIVTNTLNSISGATYTSAVKSNTATVTFESAEDAVKEAGGTIPRWPVIWLMGDLFILQQIILIFSTKEMPGD